jgi:hypothetical protein
MPFHTPRNTQNVKSQTTTTTPKFRSEIPFSILQTETDTQTPTTSEIPDTCQGRTNFLQLSLYQK